ncbi:MAG: glutamate-5-semialdehyde dehydrogenase [Verrucomicrobia bacterium GWC2_42_7]|nr:MAG: glutamate-5-semialdehyde dehydrogenase [Verrucomicrobia bacterium GWC2_42_7]
MLGKLSEPIEQTVRVIARQALAASQRLATLESEVKNRVLSVLAEAISKNIEAILEANRRDLDAARESKLRPQWIERIRLTEKKLQSIVEDLNAIIELPDPIGQKLPHHTLNGKISVKKVRVPIGVIGVVFEYNPEQAINIAALCLKSGNACILSGDICTFNTNTCIASLISNALKETHLPTRAVQLIPYPDTQSLKVLMNLDSFVKCILPINCSNDILRFIHDNTIIPVFKNYKSVCNIFIDKESDYEMVEEIVLDAVCEDATSCNAAKNLFIHQNVITAILPRLATLLVKKNMELRIDSAIEGILLAVDNIPLNPLTESDLRDERLDPIVGLKTVVSIESAIDEINAYGSGFADAIITNNKETAQKFFSGINSATVYWNASTRFTNGVEFELGPDIGISTNRMHIRGPMRLNEFCTYKYIIQGSEKYSDAI